jgi:hypothetical protein
VRAPGPNVNSVESALRLASYRLRVTLGARLGALLALALAVGLLGGVAMASAAAARGTASSYERFLARTNPPDLLLQPPTTVPCASRFVTAVSHLPLVTRAACAMALNGATVSRTGGLGTVLVTQVELVASTDGLFSSLDRPILTAGRWPRAGDAQEVMASPEAVARFHLHLGSDLVVGAEKYTPDGFEGPALGQAFYKVLTLHVVGFAVANYQLVQDDVDRGHTGLLFGAPALAREFSGCCSALTYVGLKLRGGSANDGAVESEYSKLVSANFGVAGSQVQVYVTAAIASAVQRAIRPEAVALAVFGAIAALATLAIGGQTIVRLARARAGEASVLRALGADPLAAL